MFVFVGSIDSMFGVVDELNVTTAPDKTFKSSGFVPFRKSINGTLSEVLETALLGTILMFFAI